MDEIGIRYMVCRFIAKELEDIINKVEGTAKYIAEEKKKKKERGRKKHG